MDDDLPMGTSQDVFYFTEGALAYAGYYLHAEDPCAASSWGWANCCFSSELLRRELS
jgi:hypothetical protein